MSGADKLRFKAWLNALFAFGAAYYGRGTLSWALAGTCVFCFALADLADAITERR